MNCWQDWSYFVGFVDLFSILQWQKSTNAARCEYSAWVMWIWKMCLMHILFTSILPIFVCTGGHFQSEFFFATVTVFQIGVWRPNRYHFLWQNVHVFQLGFFANTSANPFSAVESARPSSPTMPTPPPLPPPPLRRRRRARAATVFPACTRTSACWFLQCCAAWYVNAHLIPAISTEPHMHWHGVCRPKQHPITFSDSTPRCCGWNSSPSQCCASRSVLEHHISAIDILYSHRHHHYNSCHYLQHTIMTIITIHQKNANNVQ